MTGGVVFIIIIPSESYEKSLKNSKFVFGETEDDDCIKIDTYSSHEKLIEPTLIEPSVNIRNKSPLNKSKSMDLLNFDDIPNLNKISHKSWAGTGNKDFENVDEFQIYLHLPMEKVLRIILMKQNIENAFWSTGQNEYFIQVIFPLESGNCESTLEVLNEYGIGQRLNSVVSVIPCSLYYKESDLDASEVKEKQKKFEWKDQTKHSAWNKFVSSVRSRLTVAEIVESVRTNAELTFDFLILLLIATIISAIALVENNNVFLVSSMLISPMMGPVMAGTFGSVIKDWRLQKTGIKNELIGLGIATAVGFCYGTIVCVFFDKYGVEEWPSPEMISRGEIRTLWVGCPIAVLSGAAVALGILSDNIASLVGVAISTSLMPPAVNAGLLWSMSAVYACCAEDTYKRLIKTNIYFDNKIYELAALGGMSICLTFVNIVFIYLAGILVFKIKEVAPLSSKDCRRRFWTHDIKVTRDYNKTLQNDTEPIQEFLTEELGSYSKRASIISQSGILNINDMVDHLYQSTEVEANKNIIDTGRTQNTWSPSTFAPKRPSIKELRNIFLSSQEETIQRNLNFKFSFIRGNSSSPWDSRHLLTQERGLPCIPESISSGESSCGNYSNNTNTRKFTVTPAVLEGDQNNEYTS